MAVSEDGPTPGDGTAVGFAAVADALADDVASGILRETYEDARSAHELANALGTSPPTVYRRLETLREYDLVVASTRPDPDGHHTDVYRANVDRVVVHLDVDGFTVEVERTETMADRFTNIIEDM
nr:winged helix-turn-helix domain-containing protein [Halorubellus sp. JP-L1]